MTDTKLAELPPEGTWGPAMRALPNDRWRLFAIACCEARGDGKTNYTDAARRAGYVQTQAALEVTATRMAHDPRVTAALLEYGRAQLGAGVALATARIIQVLSSATKNSDILKAATTVLDRAGIPMKTEHSVAVTHEESEAEQIERAIRIATQLGLDPKKLLGNIGVAMPALPAADNSAMAEISEAEIVSTTEGLEDLLR